MRHHQVGGTRGAAGDPVPPLWVRLPPSPLLPTPWGGSRLNTAARQWQEVAEVQWWVLGDPAHGGAWRGPGVLGHKHQPGLQPGCPRQGPSLVQCTFPAECCKGNGQDVGQGQRLPLEAPKSPSSPPKSSNKKSNISSPRAAPHPALLQPHLYPRAAPEHPGSPVPSVSAAACSEYVAGGMPQPPSPPVTPRPYSGIPP